MALFVRESSASKQITVLGHLPHSPELGLSDLFLFPQIKKYLKKGILMTSCINWTQLSRSYLKTETESSLRNTVLKNKQDGILKTRQWIMSKNIIFVLMYHRHNPLDPTNYSNAIEVFTIAKFFWFPSTPSPQIKTIYATMHA
jgi:hypothetical protein